MILLPQQLNASFVCIIEREKNNWKFSQGYSVHKTFQKCFIFSVFNRISIDWSFFYKIYRRNSNNDIETALSIFPILLDCSWYPSRLSQLTTLALQNSKRNRTHYPLLNERATARFPYQKVYRFSIVVTTSGCTSAHNNFRDSLKFALSVNWFSNKGTGLRHIKATPCDSDVSSN